VKHEPQQYMMKYAMNKVIISIGCYAFSALAFLPGTVFANTEAKAAGAATIDAFSLMSILNMVMGLIVVVALILGLAWVLKKYGRLPNNNIVDMKVLGGLSLGTREKALLIEVESTRLLVGVSPGHIQTLHVFKDASDNPEVSFDETLGQVSHKKDE